MQSKKKGTSKAVPAPKTPLKTGRTATKKKKTPTPRNVASPNKRAKTAQSVRGEEESADLQDEEANKVNYATTPFTIECPARPPKKKITAPPTFRGKDGGFIELEVNYAISPARWGDLKSYSSVKYQGMELRTGDFVYFAQTLAPPEEVSEEEVLASNDPLRYERENYYLGRICDARADDASKVYIRLMYAYWPEELPQGRQKYHGMKEVVMSNHIDILDVHTIFAKVSIEKIDDSAESVHGLYWRQTLDISKIPPGKNQRPGVLSKPKPRCRCGQPMNPDHTMYVCQHCSAWNHDACLRDEILERAWQNYLAGTLGEEDDEELALQQEEGGSIEAVLHLPKSSPMFTSIRKMFRGGQAPVEQPTEEHGGVQNLQAKGSSKMKKRIPVKDKAQNRDTAASWKRRLNVIIDSTGRFGNTGVTMAQIAEGASGEAVWTTAMSCLNCERKLD